MKHQSIYNRLRRIEGTIRGIEDMVAKDKPEAEILIQLEAARSSLGSAVVSLVREMLDADGKEKVELTKEQLQLILNLWR